MRKKSRNRIPSKPVYAFVVEGETEKWYLNMLKRNERDLKVDVKPELASKKSISQQFETVVELAENEYSKVFWIVDLDVLIKEERESKGVLRSFDQLKRKLETDYDNVHVIVNNPCLEFWFLLHFKKTSRQFSDCSLATRELKRDMRDYEKTQKYYTSSSQDIYVKLKPYLAAAIPRASELGNFDLSRYSSSIAEMYMLFETLGLEVE